MIFSAVILLAARSLGCLMLLARGEVSKDAEIPVLRHCPGWSQTPPGQVFTVTLAGCSLHRRLVSRAF